MGWIVKPQFFGVKAAASNIGHGVGHYTADNFYVDYPQFFTPNGQFLGSMPMLEEIIKMANAAIQPDKWLDGWRYAARSVCGALRDAAPARICTGERDTSAGRCVRGSGWHGEIRYIGGRLCHL